MSDSEKIEELTDVVRQLTRELAEFMHRVEIPSGRADLISDRVVEISVRTTKDEISLELDAKRDAEKNTQTNDRHWEMIERIETRLRRLSAANSRIKARIATFSGD